MPKTTRRFGLLVLALAATILLGYWTFKRMRTEPGRASNTVVTGWVAMPSGVNELIVPSNQVTDEMLSQIFLHLLEEQPDYESHPPTFKPQLALSFEWSTDHKTLTFHLRNNVVWSDGVPVTAEDVRWTWQAQVNPEVAWDKIDMKSRITDVEVIDPHTVRMHFSDVYATQLLDANEGVILPKHIWGQRAFSQWRQSANWFSTNLVVDGPFTIGSWTPQQEVMLKRNNSYYEKGKPYLDRVVLRVIPDEESGLAQLLNGEVDVLPQISPDYVEQVQKDSRLNLKEVWFDVYVGIIWNNDNSLFSDSDVRRALTFGIDRQAIVATLLGPYGRVAVSPILTSVWAHDKSIQPLPYDPVAARRILAAKGWKDADGDGILDRNGRPFVFELLNHSGNKLRRNASVMIQEQLKRLGIKVEIRDVEFNTLQPLMAQGNFEATAIGQNMDTSLDLATSFHSRSVGTGGNYSRYRNPQVDRLLDIMVRQRDLGAELPYLGEIEKIIVHDQPCTFLWESKRLTAINKRVRNVEPTQLWTLSNLKEWSIR